MKQTEYTLPGMRFGRELLFALVSDLHGADPTAALGALRERQPHYILMPGDIFERLDGTLDEKRENGMRLLREAASIAPVFYLPGNHEDGGIRSWSPLWRFTVMERAYADNDLKQIRQTGTVFLCDSFVVQDGIAFGGLCSGLINKGKEPNVGWLEEFCALPTPKVLLCHHPEYYKKYLKDRPIDLVVSGHAHGGQWRFIGRGVFAPGQGIFPKYTKGLYHERLVVSTGLKPSGHIPRIFNEPEVVFVKGM